MSNQLQKLKTKVKSVHGTAQAEADLVIKGILTLNSLPTLRPWEICESLSGGLCTGGGSSWIPDREDLPPASPCPRPAPVPCPLPTAPSPGTSSSPQGGLSDCFFVFYIQTVTFYFELIILPLPYQSFLG